jgi:hypothetical protein
MGRGIGRAVPHPGGYPLVYRIIQDKRCLKEYSTFILGKVNVLPFTGTEPIVKGSQYSQNANARGDIIGVGSIRGAGVSIRPAGNLVKA